MTNTRDKIESIYIFGRNSKTPLTIECSTFRDGSLNPVIVGDVEPYTDYDIFYASRFNDPKDLLLLPLIVDALDAQLAMGKINVVIPYLPYSRQDRICNKGESRALNVIVNTVICGINSYKSVSNIFIADLHNETAVVFPSKVVLVNQYQSLPQSIKDDLKSGVTHLVLPDKGASEKLKYYNLGNINNGHIQCKKIRDTETGELSGFGIEYDKTEGTVHSLTIVDDLVEGGGTFIGLYDVLRESYPNIPINVHTTHSITPDYSVPRLASVFDNVSYTTFLTSNINRNQAGNIIKQLIPSCDKSNGKV